MSELTNVFTDIADAIRSKTGSSATMTPAQMATAIGGISTGIEKIELSQSAYDALPLADKTNPAKLYIINEHDYLYKWDFTKSRVDEIRGIEATGGNLQSDGLHLTDANSYIDLKCGDYNEKYVYEIDVHYMSKNYSEDQHGRFITLGEDQGLIFRKNTSKWEVYLYYAWRNSETTSELVNDANAFNNKTIKILCDSKNKICFYANDVLFYKIPYMIPVPTTKIQIGSSRGQSYYNATISGVRIYKNED